MSSAPTFSPFLVTDQQAGKLPRWALLLLCTLYTLPGFIGRDPWRADDAASFGVALTMARGTWHDWVATNLAGMPMADRGPLSHWIQALAIELGNFLSRTWLPASNWITEHLAARMASVVLLGLSLFLLWYAVFALASRQGVQPSDPFEVAANRIDFGRSVADSALLLLMATFGLVARAHETSVDAIQLTWTCLFLWALARSLEKPRSSGWMMGLALAATFLTRGPYLTVGFIAGWMLAQVICSPLRWSFAASSWRAAIAFTVLAGGWVLIAYKTNPAHLYAWLSETRFGIPDSELITYYLRTLPWFYWPSWPIALWAIWRWRARIEEPIVALPISLAITCSIVAVFQSRSSESALMPLIPMLAIVAAIGLPTLQRGVASLVDWFAVLSFTVFGFAIWAYWIAYMTGTPPAMARSVARIAPSHEPNLVAIELALGILASLAWLALIRWRLGRHRTTLWRPVALSCGGLVLSWFLLMTLWLPFFNDRNTYRDVALSLNQSVNLQRNCVASSVGTTERTNFFYFSNMSFEKPGTSNCRYLLIKEEGPLARVTTADQKGYKLVWEGSRKNIRDERFRLFEAVKK